MNDEEGDNTAGVEPWDVTKTVAVLWPFKRTKQQLDLTRMPLSLAYEVEYAREQSKGEKEDYSPAD